MRKLSGRLMTLALLATAAALSSQGDAGDGEAAGPAMPTSTSAAEPNPGDGLLAEAIERIEAYDTLKASIRHRTDLYGQQLLGAGTYLQGPVRYHLLRLELKLQTGPSASTLLQVCDGQHLWIHRNLLGEERLGRVDVERLREAEPAAQTSPVVLGLGGLPRLLRGLQRSFSFPAVYEAQLGQLPLHVLEGHWKPEKLAALLPGQQGAIEREQADLSQLAEHLPDRVLVCLGRDDLFPYRIEFRRAASPPAEGAAGELPRRPRSLVTVEFYEVEVNGPIDTQQFVYNPGELSAVDETEAYLKRR